MLGRIQEVHAFFRSRTRARMLATASPFNTPWLPPGYGQKLWMAVSRLIIFNPAHTDGRLANSVTHELAHLLLEHEPGLAIGPGGCRVWDQEMEDEANLLAAMLLVPRDAALACARAGLPHEIGAARFGVSTDLMRWRTDHSGAARQAQAAARQRGQTLPRLSTADVGLVMSACDLRWLQEITATQWRTVLAGCGRAIAMGSVPILIERLRQPR